MSLELYLQEINEQLKDRTVDREHKRNLRIFVGGVK